MAGRNNIKNDKSNEAEEEKTAPQQEKHGATGPADAAEEPRDKVLDRKGIWEACYESGVVIGHFEGTPRQIATYIINTVDEGSYIRKLNFLHIPVRRIPEKLIKTSCCGKSYSKNDRFCSRCGKSLEMNKKLTSKIKLEVNC
jgi:hypothetical protein